FVRVRIADAVGMREGTYAFFPGDEFKDSVQVLDLPALGPILDAARRHYPVKYFATQLAPVMKQFPYRTRGFAGELPQLGLTTRDMTVALKISGRVALDELIHQADLKDALSLIWFLGFVGAVSFSPQPAASADAAGRTDAVATPRR